MDSRELKSENASVSLNNQILIGANCKLSIKDVQFITQKNTTLSLSKESYFHMEKSHRFLQDCIDKRLPVYGLNTNFGDQVGIIDPHINNQDAKEYYDSINARQENIIKSLACGLGDLVSSNIVKATMALRAHCLAQGYSGVSPQAVEAILGCFNADITPLVHRYGSIGASGDLIPLATISAAIIGEPTKVSYQGEIMSSPSALQLAGLSQYKPQLRDGLAMINGTSFMTAIASLSLYKLSHLYEQMLAAIAMSLESMLVISSAYHPLVHDLKKHLGEIEVNHFLLDFWEGSQLLSDLDEVRTMTQSRSVQDYYSLRSVPQGFGPFRENLNRAIKWIEDEINSVNDNPIIDAANQKIHHSANFMGYYVTDACDILKIDIAQASTWLHALLANMVHPRKNQHLPVNLAAHPEKQNGFRSMQLLAASLAVQNRKFAQSQQAFMLPTEGDNQDVNSLGTHAALDLQEAVANLERLTAIMLLAGAQALELRGIEKASKKSRAIYTLIRQHSKTIAACRPMSAELSTIIELLANNELGPALQ